jgi:hypothetical protein
MKLFLDPFVLRNWPLHYGTPASFIEQVMHHARSLKLPLVDGYAPFCKHLFVPNFTSAPIGYLRITPQNTSLIRTAYEARTEQELPVLSRWFNEDEVQPLPKAATLDVILYTREQLIAEAKSMGRDSSIYEDGGSCSGEFGVVGIKCQDVDSEVPMQPITMMRNALGKEEGGSGVKFERAKYMQSVAFWQDHVLVKSAPASTS